MPFVCPTCCYPARASAPVCDNPGCESNPSVNPAQKQRWQTERDQRLAEETERERIRAIRRRMSA